MKILITGATGLLGQETSDLFEEADGQHCVVRLRGRSDIDITDTAAVVDFVTGAMPDLIIHTAAQRDVDMAERDPHAAFMINTFGTRNIALAADLCECPVIYISTDAVYDGEKAEPYTEFDDPNPVNTYGRSKLKAEEAVVSLTSKYFILRTPVLYGGKGRPESNVMMNTLSRLRAGDAVRASVDQYCGPTYARDLAEAILRISSTPYYGVYLVSNSGRTSRYEFTRSFAELAGVDPSLVIPASSLDKPTRRPRNTPFDCTCLTKTFGFTMPHWEDALARFVAAWC